MEALEDQRQTSDCRVLWVRRVTDVELDLEALSKKLMMQESTFQGNDVRIPVWFINVGS